MKKIILSPFLLVFIYLSLPLCTSAQTLYDVGFEAGEVKYSGFLVYFNEEDAYMRIGYTYNGKYNVVEVEYTSHTGQEDGYNYQVMIGQDPEFITEQAEGQRYNPDHFVWVWSDQNSVDLPFVTDDPEFNEENLLQCTRFTEVVPKQLTDDYLRQFFWSNEDQYLALRKLRDDLNTPQTAVNTTTNNTDNKPTKLHLVLCVNTEISDIGASCGADQRTMEIEFREIAKAMGIPYQKYIINGEQFTKANAKNTFNQISAGSNDIIVFYYSGHGFRWNDQTDKFPQLDMRYSDYTPLSNSTALPLSDVSKALTTKGARLNLILSDCCNSNVGRNQVTSTTFMASRSFQGAEINKLKSLFMSSRGSLVFTGSSPSEYSWCNQKGGFFTLSFMQALKEEIGYMRSNTPSWNNIIQHTIRSTQSKIRNCTSCQPQNPTYTNRITQN